MDDAGTVSSGERAGDLRGDIKHFAELHWRDSHPLAQRLAIDEFSGDEMHALPYGRATAPLVDLMDGDDVGMIQRRRGLGFLHKAPHPIRMSSNIRGQNLQRNFAIELCVLLKVNFAHSAGAKLAENPVM